MSITRCYTHSIFILFLIVSSATSVAAQRLLWEEFTEQTEPYIAINSGTAINLKQGNGLSNPINLGFDFSYNNVKYTQVRASRYGYLSFDLADNATSGKNAVGNKLRLMPWWDNFNIDNATLRYVTEGTAPNRSFSFEWSNANYPDSLNTKISFKITLFEGSNIIKFNYNFPDTLSPLFSSTIGLTGQLPTDNNSVNVLSNTFGGYYSEYSLGFNDSTQMVANANSAYTFDPSRFCRLPITLDFSGVTDSSVKVFWKKNLRTNAMQYKWSIRDYYNTDVPIAASGAVSFDTQDTIFIKGLNQLTTYRFSVEATCESFVQSNTGDSFIFETLYKDLSINTFPYKESFEVGSLPINYESIPNGPNYDWRSVTTDAPNGAVKAFDGTHFLAFDAKNTFHINSDAYQLKTNAFNLPSKSMVLKYNYWFAKNANRGAAFNQPNTLEISVQYLDSLNNIASKYLKIQNASNSVYNEIGDSIWTESSIDLTGLENKHVRFVFTNYGKTVTVENANLALDNFRIEESPCAKPIDVKTTVKHANDILITWTGGMGQTQWEIEYGVVGFTQGNGKKILVSASPYTLKNLTANQQYAFYIRAVCGNNLYSETAGPFNFATLCDYVTSFPYTEGFENNGNLPNCWNFNLDVPTVPRSKNPQFLKAADNRTRKNGNYCAILNSDTVASSAYLRSPAFVLDNTPKQLRYSYKQTGDQGGDIGAGTCHYEFSVEISTDLDNWSNLYTHNCYNSYFDNFNWFQNTVSLAKYVNQTVFIRYKITRYYDLYQATFYVDDVTIENIALPLIEPIVPSVSKLRDDKSVVVAWTPGSTETAWEVEYGKKNFKQGSGTLINVTVQPSTVIPNVSQTDSLEYYVRGNYGSNKKSIWVGPFQFPAPETAVYDITSAAADNIFWKAAVQKLNATVEVSGLKAKLSTASSYQTQMYLMTPRILNIKDKTHHLTFTASKAPTFGRMELELGFMSNPGDFATYVPYRRYNLKDTTHFADENFSDYTGSSQFLVFHYIQAAPEDNFAEINISGITWEKFKTCETPINVKATKYLPTSTAFSWSTPQGVGKPTGFKWKICDANGISPYSNALQSGLATSNAVTISGLTPETDYNFYVQSYCNNLTDTSNYWSVPFAFTSSISNDACEVAKSVVLSVSLEEAKITASQIAVRAGLHQEIFDSNVCSDMFHDVWYKFTTSNVDTFTVGATFEVAYDQGWGIALYKGDCNTLKLLSCSDGKFSSGFAYDNRQVTAKVEPNTTYYIRLSPKTPYDVKTGKLFVYCNGNCPSYLINDVCPSALPVVSYQGYTINTTNKNAVPDKSFKPSCEPSDSIYDVWIDMNMGFSATQGLVNVTYQFSKLETGKALKYMLYKGDCDNLIPQECNAVKEGGEISILGVEANQVYKLRVWSNRFVDESSFTFNVKSAQYKDSVTIANAVTTSSCRAFASVDIDKTNANLWVPLMDGTQLVAEINANGNILGGVSGSYFRNKGAIRKINNTPYMDRNIGIAATTQPASPVSVRLYLTDAEYQAYKTAVGGDMTFGVTHYAGSACTLVANNIPAELLAATFTKFRDNGYYIEFKTKSFSEFFVSMNKILTGVNDAVSVNTNWSLKNIFPNPASDNVTLSFESIAFEPVDISISDISGKVLQQERKSLSVGASKIELNLNTLSEGVYIVKCQNATGLFVNKIIVRK